MYVNKPLLCDLRRLLPALNHQTEMATFYLTKRTNAAASCELLHSSRGSHSTFQALSTDCRTQKIVTASLFHTQKQTRGGFLRLPYNMMAFGEEDAPARVNAMVITPCGAFADAGRFLIGLKRGDARALRKPSHYSGK